MTIYAIPFSYGWATRAKTAFDKLSFFAIFIIPVWFVCGMPISLRFVIGVIAEYSLYEIGYLINDYFTVRKETMPNHRLPQEKHAKIEKYLIQISATRITIVILSLIYLRSQEFTVALAYIAVIFALHNTIRCNWNIFTYFLLCLGKYLALPALHIPEKIGEACLILALAFVIPRTIEHASKPKYRLPFLKSLNHNKFRAVYSYILASTATMFAPFSLLFFVALWYYVYRVVVLAIFLYFGDPRKKPSPQL